MTNENVLADRCAEVARLTRDALAWVNNAENAETVGPRHKSLTKMLRRSARRADRLAQSARTKMSVSVFGPSQAGKSFLVSVLARPENGRLTADYSGPGGQLALFTINKQCSTDAWQAFLADHRTDFMLLGHFMHQRVLQLAGLEQTQQTRPLSAREKDAMRLIAKGMSRGRASEQLGISENTFRVYIDSARHKLGALNIPNAIALAVHRGIIPPA